MKMALRCFVAMALGREDTERVYDNLIVPPLRNKGITPIRIDRVNFIDEIDDRIISELRRSDFVLADLTYARPSVYFEAGFGEREVPVIYTCRKDHLSPKADDKFGNFRIHFDLQMKNIIPWSDPSDRVFSKKLEKRIALVIAPLLKVKQTKKLENKRAAHFSALSLKEKTQRILRICISHLRRNKYQGIDVEYEKLSEWFRRHPTRPHIPPYQIVPQQGLINRAQELQPGWLGQKTSYGMIHVAMVHVTPSLTKSKLTRFRQGIIKYPVYRIRTEAVERILEYIFVCSFKKVPALRVHDSLIDFQLDKEGDRFVWISEQWIPIARLARNTKVYVTGGREPMFIVSKPRRSDPFHAEIHDGEWIGQMIKVPRHIHVHVLDSIRFEEAFAQEFSTILKKPYFSQ